MGESARLSVTELRSVHTLTRHAPFAKSMPYVPGPIKDVSGVLDWLAVYLRHVDSQVTKLRETDQDRARAVVILNGMRRDLDNAADTLRELDASIVAGTLPFGTVLDE